MRGPQRSQVPPRPDGEETNPVLPLRPENGPEGGERKKGESGTEKGRKSERGRGRENGNGRGSGKERGSETETETGIETETAEIEVEEGPTLGQGIDGELNPAMCFYMY